MSNVTTDNININSNYLSIKNTNGEVELHLTVDHTNSNLEPLSVHVVGYDDELSFYDELSVDDAKQMRDYMNITYPLTLKELLRNSVISLKSMLVK